MARIFRCSLQHFQNSIYTPYSMWDRGIRNCSQQTEINCNIASSCNKSIKEIVANNCAVFMVFVPSINL